MTVRLTVLRNAWEAHVHELAASIDGLVPVVKGNGYGFGRDILHPLAATLADEVCVGTIHELDAIPAHVTPIVLTPTRVSPQRTDVLLTVGASQDVDALRDWCGSVLIKLRSSMSRFGVAAERLAALVDTTRCAGLTIRGASVHLPLAGTDVDRRNEIDDWLPHLDPAWPVYVSHLTPSSFGALRDAHPDRSMRLRVGTSLWHGDKSFLHLGADVLAVQQVDPIPVDLIPVGGDRAARPLVDGELVEEGPVAGYRHLPVAPGSTVVMIGAGSANGIAASADGASPFHYRRRRLALLEPPHMHSSMVVIAAGDDVPAVGAIVDVQRPLIATTIDELVWS